MKLLTYLYKMESQIVVRKDLQNRTVVQEKLKPWGWGRSIYGFQLAYVIIWILFRLFKKHKLIFNEKTETIKLRRSTIPFTNIKLVEASLYEEVLRLDQHGLDKFEWISKLELLLTDGGKIYIGTAWFDNEIKEIGQNIADLLNKPFIWPVDVKHE
ncbi:MAG: hypothetical protein NTV30_00680 [Chloroflexi bacterium]|nr:hypothetical protein [Chloroflexota bacterium]